MLQHSAFPTPSNFQKNEFDSYNILKLGQKFNSYEKFLKEIGLIDVAKAIRSVNEEKFKQDLAYCVFLAGEGRNFLSWRYWGNHIDLLIVKLKKRLGNKNEQVQIMEQYLYFDKATLNKWLKKPFINEPISVLDDNKFFYICTDNTEDNVLYKLSKNWLKKLNSK